ncbi:MAG: FMN-binding protein [Lachnospiraceae bacterium]|nr:FMN-binding protein [Lachnospiraceae bacterium]
MKRMILLVLCAIFLLSTALAETTTVTVDGVDEHVTVTLTMDGDRIKAVEASSDYTEADARGKEALSLIADAMVEKNTFSVDTISGATCTSNAVIAGAIKAWMQITTDRMIQEAWMQESFTYEHDPRDNPEAMKDIIYNPAAVYGFSPSPDSTRLKDYVDALDWTDPDQVAEARALRQAYHDSMSELYRMIEDLLHEGKDVETIARAVSQRRNELRLESEADDPEALALTKKSNLEAYGNEMGPTADQLYEKYGSWQTVLEKARGTNAGMDACLGFYDEYYDFYDIEAEPLVGSWESIPHEAASLPADAQTAFDKATEGRDEYIPVALLSRQIVSGTDYCILCQITQSDVAPAWSLVYIHADPKGNAGITNVYELYIDRHSTPAE